MSENAGGVPIADALPAKLLIFSDGKFEDVSGFSLGNLEPVFVPIVAPQAANVAITAFASAAPSRGPKTCRPSPGWRTLDWPRPRCRWSCTTTGGSSGPTA